MKKDTKKDTKKNRTRGRKKAVPKKVSSQMRKDSAGVAVAGGFFRIALYVCIAVAVIYIGKSAYSFGYAIFNQQPMEYGEGTDVTVVIKDGTSVYKIGKILEDKGLIEDAKVFVVQEKLSEYKDSLKAGTYILNTTMPIEDQMAILAQVNTEGQPSQIIEDNEAEQGSADAVYDKVSEDVEAGDVEEGADEVTGEVTGEGGEEAQE
ncbi:MAG: endolytic transglycosylase MltG [Lachnospiraceae bacterium]|jgi:UPF0755 protein